MKPLVLACLALALSAAPAAALVPLPVTKGLWSDHNAVMEIRAEYPKTGDAGIDADILATVGRIAQNFRKEATETHDPKEAPYTLDVTYRVARNDTAMFDVVFNDEWDFHGAHPNTEIVTANYFRAGSWRVYLPELFDGDRGLVRISALATADLDRRLLVPDGFSDKDWIARGADAHWNNFQAFVLLSDVLEIEFPPYQVAAYADGPQSARLPLARLRDVMRPDPRAPVPSFACARAVSENERAICADVALARLDRDVAQSWSSQMRNENDPVRKTRLKTDQVAWLNHRDNACRAGVRIPCLMALYRARLLVLEAGE
jgi:hypothetical protein